MNRWTVVPLAVACAAIVLAGCDDLPTSGEPGIPPPDPQDVFRFETFGNETWWTDTLAMNQVIQGAVDPLTALAVGLKVDADALPEGILGQVDLSDPATTVELIRLNAVVGVQGEVDDAGNLTRMGITCGLCHSTVDNSVMPGIGSRLDGWPNLDLDPGLIVSLSPFFQSAAAQAVLTSWGPGMFDPRFNIDGISDPVVIPPAYGLDGVALETFTGDGPVSYWNAYVAVTQMHGHGDFEDPRIGVAVDWHEDRVSPLLQPLLEYQLSLAAPAPPAGSFDPEGAQRGRQVFEAEGCADCHTGPLLTDAAVRLHLPSETCMDPTLAQRAGTGMYRTTPLRALWQHAPYFHDGSAETPAAVVDHYVSCLGLELIPQRRADLIEYLKSL